MKLEEAIEKLLDGDAIMFAGAGCSIGAINLRDKPFPIGDELAKYLADKASITDTISLEDAADAYVERYGNNSLVIEIQNSFTAKVIADHHIQIGGMPWKRLYTTNYDDVLEEAYKENSKKLVPITTSDDPFKIPKGQTICIHFNGFVHKLDLDKIGTELKLTEASYLSAELAESPWASNFRQDIRFSRAVFFLGYSLHDLDIKRILYDSPSLKEKCFFILGKSVDATTVRRANRFGTVCKISVAEFCHTIQKKRRTYMPVKKTHLYTLSIKEHTPPHGGKKVTDRDFTDLLVLGKRNENMLFESLKSKQRYVLQRKVQDQVFDQIDQGHRLMIICSDLGNGKTLFLDGLRLRALERGFRVFEVREHNEEAAAELDMITQLNENVLITIEEYQDWLTEISQFMLKASDKAVLVLTARNAIHDVVIDSLIRQVGLEFIPEIYLDILDSTEIDWFVDALDEYGLWGRLSSKQRFEKVGFIKTICRGQIHALLLKLIDSPDIGQRLRDLADSLKKSKEKYEILLGICIMTLLNQMPSLDALVDVFGTEVLMSTQFRRDPTVKQFLDFPQNEVLVKSPIAAQYILNRIADPALIVSVLSKMAIRVHTSALASRRYQGMLTNFIRFSNLQMILPEEGRSGAVISYYESIKNLARCKNSPLFWLQYAIACLAINDLFRSKRYFETAYSYADQQWFDTFQIDNHYARFLLVEAVEKLEPKAAMDNLRKARTIINRQIRDEKLHYPYRVASQYQPFLDRFKSLLPLSQIKEIGEAASDVTEMIERLPFYRRKHRYIRDCRKAMYYVMDRVKELTIDEEDNN